VMTRLDNGDDDMTRLDNGDDVAVVMTTGR
jgi:hypothetical protein